MNHQVLIIDDDEMLANALRHFLVQQGLLVDSAAEREEAEALLTHIPYSLVITDLSLTSVGAEGIDLLKFISGLQVPPKTIVLTGHTEATFQVQAKSSGADVYLNKPVKLSVLASAAHELLETPDADHSA